MPRLEDLLLTDQAILDALQGWLDTVQLDRVFQGSFPTWPCADFVPHLTLRELLDTGADPVDAFLHLVHLAQRVCSSLTISIRSGRPLWVRSDTNSHCP